MAKQSQAWKNLERETARKLGGRRISRGSDFSVSDVDVVVDDFPALRIDCKYRAGGFAHHALVDEIDKKYCHVRYSVDGGDVVTEKNKFSSPVLVTKSGRQRGEYVTTPIECYAHLINDIRDLIAANDMLGYEIEQLQAKVSELSKSKTVDVVGELAGDKPNEKT